MIMKTLIYIIRHAEAEGNYIRKFHGITDSELTKKGYLQANMVSNRLKDVKFDIIYSSPLKRAYTTAKIIAKNRDINIILKEELKEINGGDWENRNWDDLPKLWPKEYECWELRPHEHCMPNGESMLDLYNRAVNILESIVKENEGKTICIVTHGTLIRALLIYLKRLHFENLCNIYWQDNTAVNIIEYNNGTYNLIVEGDSSHLSEELSTFLNQEWWKSFLENRNKK